MNVLEKPTLNNAPQIATREAYYTICPVFVASNVAVELGWLDEEFKRIDAKLSYLRSLPPSLGWLPHFNHRFEHLFRDGGNIPSIWAKADIQDTKLIGLTAAHDGGRILVRANSGIHRVCDLKGRKIGLSKSLVTAKIDWWRATAERGILLALELAGLARADVEIVDLENLDERSFGLASRPSDLWTQRRRDPRPFTPEIAALQGNRVDAIYASEGRALTLERSGLFTVIEDLDRYPDWTLQVANSPYAITVNSDFADQQRDVIVAFLRAAIRAGRWINENRAAAAAILARVTDYPTVADVAAAIAETEFIPSLSDRDIAGVEIEKNFLLERAYIHRDFNVRQWADPSYLGEASASL